MKILYSKFNRNRLPGFQIKTSILKDQGSIYVEKQALNEEAYAHIGNIYNNYLSMQSKYQNVRFVETIKLGEDRLRFEFVEGNTMDELLFSSIKLQDMNLFFEYLKGYIKLLRLFGTKNIPVFQADDKFLKVFNYKPRFENVECFSETNVDLTFDNILVNKTDKVIIDFEWIFGTVTPMNYIIFRSLSRFYWKYGDYLRGFLKIEEIFQELGITDVEQYQEMEKGFQTFVLGDRQYEINSRYRREVISLPQLINQNNKYSINLEGNAALFSASLLEIEELKREIDGVRQQKNEIYSKLTHAQFQSEELKNKLRNLENENLNLKSDIHQIKNEIDTLSSSVLATDVHITNKLDKLRRIERTWRGSVVKKIIGREYVSLSREIEKCNELRVEEYHSKLVLSKNNEITEMKNRLADMEQKLEQSEQTKLSYQLEINHLKTHLSEILDKHHNLDLQNKHLAQQNHENTVKNKELIDAYQTMQEEFHQLKYQNEKLLNQIYKGLRKEENRD
jgi:predicted  nucleic acid-binding Zn-ribbon protein